MRKIIFAITLMMCTVGALNAQKMDQAIGIRFGYGGEISYQQPLGNANRLELDLGLNAYGFGLSGVYQWVWDLSSLADGFNWYAGVGAGIGSYNFARNSDFRYQNTVLNVGILGQIGMEYNFDIPLQLSLDWRPGFFLLNSSYPSFDGICLAARYRF